MQEAFNHNNNNMHQFQQQLQQQQAMQQQQQNTGNKQYKSVKQTASSNMAQLSQRSAQLQNTQHHKANSIGSKIGITTNLGQQNNLQSIDNQQQIQYAINQAQQAFASNSQYSNHQKTVKSTSGQDVNKHENHHVVLQQQLNQFVQQKPSNITINQNSQAEQQQLFLQQQQILQQRNNNNVELQLQQKQQHLLDINKPGHKKSNSMMNSKMAQILLKNANAIGQPNNMQIIQNNQVGIPGMQTNQQQMTQNNNMKFNQTQLNKKHQQNISSNTNQQQPFFYPQQNQQQQNIQKMVMNNHNNDQLDSDIAGTMSIEYENRQQYSQPTNRLVITNNTYTIDTQEEVNDINNLIYSQHNLKNQMITDNNIQQQQMSLPMQLQHHHKKQQSVNINSQTASLLSQQQQQMMLQQQFLQQNQIGQNNEQLMHDTKYSQVLKKQISQINNTAKAANSYQSKGNSARKDAKKTITNQHGHHQRTKSDTYYNRGSITIKQNQQPSAKVGGNGGKTTQANAKMLIEAHQQVNSRQIVNPHQIKNIQTAGVFAQNYQNSHIQDSSNILHSHLVANTFQNNSQQSQVKKFQSNTTNHSKKPSYQNPNSLVALHNPILHSTQGKQKSQINQNDKYNELKAMYDDLLEKHQVQQQIIFQQQQQQQQISKQGPNKIMIEELKAQQQPQITMNYNGIKQKSINLQQMQNNIATNNLILQQPLDTCKAGLSYDNNQISTNTPRIKSSNTTGAAATQLVSHQISHSTINNQNSKLLSNQATAHEILSQNMYENIAPKNILQIPAKLVKQATTKLDQEQLHSKAIIKMQLPQGQSRKSAQGNHKRSVSDGNEHLFKFKQQQAMQKFLYPQPSNQAIQTINLNVAAAPLNSEETLGSGRQQQQISTNPIVALQKQKNQNNNNGQQQLITPYMVPNHQRRVSDDHKHKKKQQQLTMQNSNQNLQNEVNNQQNINQIYNENVQSDQFQDDHKFNTVEFNIKNFLLEMRNKHNLVLKQTQLLEQQQLNMNSNNNVLSMQNSINNSRDLLNDDQLINNKYSYNPPSPNLTSSNTNQNNQHNTVSTNMQQSNFHIQQQHLLLGKIEQNNHDNFRQQEQQQQHQQFAMIIEENSPLQNQRDYETLSNLQPQINNNFSHKLLLQQDPLNNNNQNINFNNNFHQQQKQKISKRDSSIESFKSKELNISIVSSNRINNVGVGNLERRVSQKHTRQDSSQQQQQALNKKQNIDKRSSSPNLEINKKQQSLAQKNLLAQAKHKRIKSDVPELPKKQQNFLGNFIINSQKQNQQQQNPLSINNGNTTYKGIQQSSSKIMNNSNSISQNLGNNNIMNSGGLNIFINSDKTTPRKKISMQQLQSSKFNQQQQSVINKNKSQQINKQNVKKSQQQQPFSFGIGSDLLYQQHQFSEQLESNSSKKVINVSIDLIQDANGVIISNLNSDNNTNNDNEEDYDIVNENISYLNDSNMIIEDDQQEQQQIQVQLQQQRQKQANNKIKKTTPQQQQQYEIGSRIQAKITKIEKVTPNNILQQDKKQINKINKPNQQQNNKQFVNSIQKSTAKKNTNKISGIHHQTAFSGGNDLLQRHDKYKKMLLKYDNQHESRQKSNRKQNVLEINNNQQNQQSIHSQSVSPSGIQTFNFNLNNNILQQQQSPQNSRFSIHGIIVNNNKNEQENFKQKQQSNKVNSTLSPKQVQLQQQLNQGISSTSIYSQQLQSKAQSNQKQIKPVKLQNFMQPQQQQQQQFQQQIAQINPKQNYEKQLLSQVKQSQQQPQNQQQNIINNSNTTAHAPNNSAVQTQESPRSSLIINPQQQQQNKQLQQQKQHQQSPLQQQQIKINFNNIKEQSPKSSCSGSPLIFHKQLQQQSNNNNNVISIQLQSSLQNERLDTQDSAISDINQTPRTKGINKLIRHIKLSFKQQVQNNNQQQAPSTTVDFYRIGKVLGKGAFGKVNLALHKLSGRFAAVKSINKQYLSEEAQTKKVMQEVVILKRTRHRNIVRLYEFFETQKHILFVIELCASGDLLNYVRKRRRLKEDVAKSVFKQIIEGLGYCHSKNILHRDIKLDNILLDSEGEVKICDFGVSKIVKKGEIMTEQCGTPAYIAPEILRDKGYEGFAVDIWSAGVVLYAMLYGTVPFKANNMSELQKLILKAQYTLKDDISEEARDLLTNLLEKDPKKRITIEQILKHKWLQDANEEKVELFSQQEKDYIKNEFTYSQTDRLNRNTLLQIATQTNNNNQNNNYIETDPFTEHMLDSTNNSMLKNQSSKSVILAPFNSTKSNLNDNYNSIPALTESMRALLQSRKCIKFAARCRDANKQYEINNNAELDNGVYHQQNDDEQQDNNKNEEIKDNNIYNDDKSIINNDIDDKNSDFKPSPKRNNSMQALESMHNHQSISKNQKNEYALGGGGVGARLNTGNDNDSADDSLQSSFNKETSLQSIEDDEELKESDLLINQHNNLGDQQQQQVYGADIATRQQLNNSINKINKGGKQTELQKLESLIIQQEINDEIIMDQQQQYDDNNPYEENKQNMILIRDEKQQQQQQFQLNITVTDTTINYSPLRGADQMRMNPRVHQSHNNVVLGTAQTLIIDEEVLAIVEMMGYPRDYIIRCLNNNELNYATTGYYLLQNKHSLSFGPPPLPQMQQISLLNTQQNLKI